VQRANRHARSSLATWRRVASQSFANLRNT
jgi:hypothetical protein